MKLLVIQEQHFTELPNGEVWVDKQSDIHFWDRYLNVFDEIVVCARLKKSDRLTAKALRSDRDRVSFVAMPDFRGVSGIVKHFFEIQRALYTALKQVDCVIFRAPSPISMVSYGAVKLSGKPFAVELMNNPRTHFSANAMQHWYQPIIARIITKQTEQMCLKANGVSYVTKQVLQDLYPSTAKLEGETIQHFESSYSTINLASKQIKKSVWPAVRPEPVILVHSGEMADYRKGQPVFIDAISQLIKRGFNVEGVLIGDGDKRSEFEQYAKDANVYESVEFVGWKSGFEQVQNELMKGQIFVFPSLGEGLPRSVIEAMASGLLCIGSRIDGVPELLDEDLLVNDFDGMAFANCIERYLLDWKTAGDKRELLFEKSHDYEASKLTAERNVFYKKLKDLASL